MIEGTGWKEIFNSINFITRNSYKKFTLSNILNDDEFIPQS